MPHLTPTLLHRHDAEGLLVLVPVVGYQPADVTVATFRAMGVTTIEASLLSGIAVTTVAAAAVSYPDAVIPDDYDDDDAVLVVQVPAADIAQLGVGRWRHQIRAGGTDPDVIAAGWTIVTRTIAAPT